MVVSFSTRFSLTSFVKRVKKLSDDQRNVIKRMGFGHLLEMPSQTLSKNLLVELMDRWSCEKKAFELSSGELRITLMDVALILGLRVTGEPVVLKEDEPFSDLEKEYGATIGKRNIAVASLEKRLQSLSTMVNEDFIRTFLLFTFGTFLFSNASGTVDSRYLSLLENFDNVPKFAWGAAVLEDLFYWMDRRKNDRMIQYMGSCVVFLQIWSYEHIDIARPSLPEYYLTFPRACRWQNSSYRLRQWFTNKFEELQENQIISQLQVTSDESNVDIIRELLEMKIDTMELPSTSKYSSTSNTVVNEDNLRSRTQLLEEQAVVSEESEVAIISESLEVQKDNMGLPSTSQYSSTDDTVGDEDNLRIRNRMLEEQNLELKKEVHDLKRENELLRGRIFSEDNLADRLERIVLEYINEEREEMSQK